MFFLPYKLDFPYRQRINFTGVPFFTLIFGALCFVIFILQMLSESVYAKGVVNYCAYDMTDEVTPVFRKLGGSDGFNACVSFLYEWDINTTNKSLDSFSYEEQLSLHEQQLLLSELDRFNAIVLDDPITTQWWHDPLSSEVTQYFTSSFLHADWEHLLLNLVFFFAFSVTMERLVGSLIYLVFFSFCCVVTGAAYEANFFGMYSNLPSLGLSGVVMGVMTFVACIYPLKKMVCFFWFVIPLIRVRIPVILLVSFYVLTDVYGLAYLMEESNINYIAHLAGAVAGIAFAILYYLYTVFLSKVRVLNQ
jgi:membrane associated rhomboid family serine protease